ncbi:ferredoxin-type protein NapG [Helicobacter sp. 12S02232-10]|uniref:ferredoxin-type protein NapG n=1 Tax=Helicobacter sp. 12S02232-10 TaxID=1476197 RepID=UPI000BA607A0|nr:ferredoxin-type protein NapG [Helicobacter sp. 12S02232-10]PAF48220.1 ferredoxin-type protein NapG [Helicobacter sp. 12S02232-10]
MGFDESRRRSLLKMTQAAGMLAVGGLIWSAYIYEAKATSLLLLPPGAKQKDEFLKSCIKCGMCVEACPYYTLKLAKPLDNLPVGVPYFTPRDIPCYMCKDVPCVNVCPSGALDKELLTDNGRLDVNKSRMGVAIVDTKNCIAYAGIQCDACYRACPLIDKALYLEYKRNDRTGKHSFLLPMVDNDVCTGCGKCERACVTEIASITVLPRDVVLGKMGTNYIKGWDKQDESRLKDASTQINKTSKDKATDYLNSGGDL